MCFLTPSNVLGLLYVCVTRQECRVKRQMCFKSLSHLSARITARVHEVEHVCCHLHLTHRAEFSLQLCLLHLTLTEPEKIEDILI